VTGRARRQCAGSATPGRAAVCDSRAITGRIAPAFSVAPIRGTDVPTDGLREAR